MAEAHEFDPFVNTEQVDEDEEMLRLLDQDIREIDEGPRHDADTRRSTGTLPPMATNSPTVPKR